MHGIYAFLLSFVSPQAKTKDMEKNVIWSIRKYEDDLEH